MTSRLCGLFPWLLPHVAFGCLSCAETIGPPNEDQEALGSVVVTVVTIGIDPDPNGYTVAVSAVDVMRTAQVSANGKVTLTRLAAGDYTVTLRGLSSNCAATDANTRAARVVNGDTVMVSFEIACTAVATIAYSDGDIYVIRLDGLVATRITDDPAHEDHPAWSPDGSRIAFTSWRADESDIYVMNANGTNRVRLTDSPELESHPAWSPDGSRIAFETLRDQRQSDIYTMNADGTNSVGLTNGPDQDGHPAWSPDGTRIAFVRNGLVHIMNADGTNILPLTTGPGWAGEPAWSPDGSRIVFTRWTDTLPKLYVMNADGTHMAALTGNDGERSGSWSADGGSIAYVEMVCCYDYYGEKYPYSAGLGIVTTNGATRTSLVSGFVSQPAWRQTVFAK